MQQNQSAQATTTYKIGITGAIPEERLKIEANTIATFNLSEPHILWKSYTKSPEFGASLHKPYDHIADSLELVSPIIELIEKIEGKDYATSNKSKLEISIFALEEKTETEINLSENVTEQDQARAVMYDILTSEIVNAPVGKHSYKVQARNDLGFWWSMNDPGEKLKAILQPMYDQQNANQSTLHGEDIHFYVRKSAIRVQIFLTDGAFLYKVPQELQATHNGIFSRHAEAKCSIQKQRVCTVTIRVRYPQNKEPINRPMKMKYDAQAEGGPWNTAEEFDSRNFMYIVQTPNVYQDQFPLEVLIRAHMQIVFRSFLDCYDVQGADHAHNKPFRISHQTAHQVNQIKTYYEKKLNHCQYPFRDHFTFGQKFLRYEANDSIASVLYDICAIELPEQGQLNIPDLAHKIPAQLKHAMSNSYDSEELDYILEKK